MLIKLSKVPFCFSYLIFLLLFVLSCGADEKEHATKESATPQSFAKGELELYTCLYGPTEKTIIEAYSRSHQVKVNVLFKPCEELIAQVLAEKENCPADIILLDDIAYLFQLKNAEMSRVLISNIISEQLPEGLRDPEGFWFAISQRAMGIIYAKDRVNPDVLKNYKDVVKISGKIVKPDPSSTSFRSFIGSIIARIGFNKAKEWGDLLATKFVDSGDFMKSITDGNADLAFMYSSDYLAALEAQPELANSIGFTLLENDKGYQSINVNGLIFARYSQKNISNALRFIEFLTDKQAQEILAKEGDVYPVHQEVQASSALKALGAFKPDPLDLESLGLQQSQAVKLMKEW